MNNLAKAKSLLTGDNTCVLVKADKVYISTKSGIAPMMEHLEKGTDLKGFSVADKIVGKAAAMLFHLAGLIEVHARVLSKSAMQYLKAHNIKVTYDTLADNIINREGTGLCPMEETVKDIDDTIVAYQLLKEKLARLRSKK